MNTVDSQLPDAIPSRRIRREIFQLSALILIAIGTFVSTRALAGNSRRINLSDASEWYRRGEADLARGDSAGAIDSFRRATAKNRGDRVYALALARALEQSGNPAAAAGALLALRESAPEDTEINLELARLAAAREDADDALRFYRNALYAPATAADEVLRRTIRLELITFLLAHGDKSRALAELLAASTDALNDVPSAVRLGRLFAAAGDYRRAQDQFERALRLDPGDPDALEGAGTAAFQLEDYADARRYLRGAPSGREDVERLRNAAESVISNDPLGARLASSERRHRLMTDLAAVQQRLSSCATQGRATDAARMIAEEVDTFVARVTPRSAGDGDVLEAGLDLIYRAEQAANDGCAAPSTLDRALLLIGRLHGVHGA